MIQDDTPQNNVDYNKNNVRSSVIVGGLVSDAVPKESNTPDINLAKNAFGIIQNNSSIDAATLVDSVLGGFASSVSDIGRGVVGGFKINNSKIKGSDKKASLMQQLIDLILGIAKLPIRFLNLFKSIGFAGAALGVGISGIAKSVALGTKDLYLLIVAILKIVFKYALCLVSFYITTAFGGCLFIHPITLFFALLYLAIMNVADFIRDNIGFDFTSTVDQVFEHIKWPSQIQTLCYSCFGKPVKLREVLSDVSVIEDIGNTISYDFNYHIPRYMKPSIPFGNKALNSLDKAMN